MSDGQCGDDVERPVHPLERLKKRAEERRERREKEVVHCPECDTEVLKDEIESAVDTAENHDEQRHNGNLTTKINDIVPPQFTEEQKEQIQNAVQSLRSDTDRSDGGSDE